MGVAVRWSERPGPPVVLAESRRRELDVHVQAITYSFVTTLCPLSLTAVRFDNLPSHRPSVLFPLIFTPIYSLQSNLQQAHKRTSVAAESCIIPSLPLHIACCHDSQQQSALQL
jgi:hypothetical protein